MHELSLIESMLSLVEEERQRQDFSRVRKIRLDVGALGNAWA
jgi:Zn finger protein HypA/HybF involved in hydrogenase expression